jgi:amidase
MTRDDPVGAFMPGARITLAGAAAGPLAGLRFAVKDLFEIAGHVASFGNPDWARTHPPAVITAPCVTLLCEAGATMVGKTVTVELAAGLTGENPWYGTPCNPACPDRLPGGSSSGSAAGVAAGLFDFALGTDTAGSVRIPASYCGLYGIRPTWGAINSCGVLPLAPSFDTVGWLTREPGLLQRIGEVLLPPDPLVELGPLSQMQDAWTNADPAVAAALTPAVARLFEAFGAGPPITVLEEGLPAFFDAFRATNNEENLAALGSWVASVTPTLTPVVQARFDTAPHQPAAVTAWARRLRASAGARIRTLLADGRVLVFPTAPCPALSRQPDPQAVQAFRERAIPITAVSGFSGAPEISLPVARIAGAPVGLSLLAAPGSDRALLALAVRAAAVLGLD